MTSEFAKVEDEVKAEVAKIEAEFEPAEKVVVTDAEAIGSATLNFIKTKGLTDLYGIAKAALLGAATGTPWTTTLATVVTQGEAAGIQIAKGAEAVVVAQAQADLIADGSLLPPVSAAPAAVAATPTA